MKYNLMKWGPAGQLCYSYVLNILQSVQIKLHIHYILVDLT